MAVRSRGFEELAADIQTMIELIEEPELVTRPLAEGMRRFAHIDTGFLKNSTYYRNAFAGATAKYAEYEARRGGDHDFAGRAVGAFDMDRYADQIVEPF